MPTREEEEAQAMERYAEALAMAAVFDHLVGEPKTESGRAVKDGLPALLNDTYEDVRRVACNQRPLLR